METPTPDEITARVTRILQQDFKVDPQKITPAATFRGDMALDSLDVVDLVFFVQKEFQIKAKVEEYQDVKTLARLVDHLHKKILAAAAAAP